MNKQIEKAEAEGFDVILDGYPRDKQQAEYISENMADKISGAIILDVPKEELLQRLELRGRDDDKERDSIERRFTIFEENINAIIPLLESKGVSIRHADGTGTVEEVTARLVDIVKEFEPTATEQEQDVNGEEIEKSYGE